MTLCADKLVQALVRNTTSFYGGANRLHQAYTNVYNSSRLVAAGSSESRLGTVVKIWQRLPLTRETIAGMVDKQALPALDMDVSLLSSSEGNIDKADCFTQSGTVASESEAKPRRYSPQLVFRQIAHDIQRGVVLVMDGIDWFRGW